VVAGAAKAENLQTIGRSDTTQPVPDRQPPSIRLKLIEPVLLWPANHEMVEIFLDYTATDNSGKVTTSLLIESNEPQSGLTGGDLFPDWEILDDQHIRLRAERALNNNGRVYTITIRAIDSAGNRAERYVRVTVPRNKSDDQRTEGWYNPEKEATNQGGDLACRVSPNPSTSFFEVEITSAASSDVISVRVLDVNGRPVETAKLWRERTIRVGRDLPRGTYHAEVRQGDQMLRIQLTRQ
jgi:hypothetical protein